MAMYLSSNGTDPLVVDMHGCSMEGEIDGAEVLLKEPEKDGFSAAKVVGVAVDDWVDT